MTRRAQSHRLRVQSKPDRDLVVRVGDLGMCVASRWFLLVDRSTQPGLITMKAWIAILLGGMSPLSHTCWPTGGIAAAVLAASVLLSAEPATAQPPRPDAPKFKVGDVCNVKSADAAGIVKMDPCGRLYCERAEIKANYELHPDIAAKHRCTWRVEITRRGQFCRCRSGSLPQLAPFAKQNP